MRKARRRVTPRGAEETGVEASDMFHHCRHRNRPRVDAAAALRGLHQRRTTLVIVILDLAVQALKALRGDDLARFLDRPHRAGALAQAARVAAFRAPLEEVD